MSDTSNEQQFIEAMDRSMLQFFNLHGFYPSQSIEIVAKLGDRAVTYRIERGPVSHPQTAQIDTLAGIDLRVHYPLQQQPPTDA